MKKEKPNFPSNVDIEYQIPTGVSEGDTSLTIKFRIKRNSDDDWTEVDDYVVQVQYVSYVQVAIDMIKKFSDKSVIIREKTKIDQTEWFASIDGLFSDIIQANKPDFPSSVDVEYKIPTTLAEDGNLSIYFRIRNKTSETWEEVRDFQIQVEGISTFSIYNYLD